MSEQKKKIPEKKVEKQFGESAEHTFTNPPRFKKKPEKTNVCKFLYFQGKQARKFSKYK